jgi:hypothetical protein
LRGCHLLSCVFSREGLRGDVEMRAREIG